MYNTDDVETVHIILLDFDACVTCYNFQKNKVEPHMSGLAEHMATRANQANLKFLMSGSLRQDYDLDKLNCTNTGSRSSFLELDEIAIATDRTCDRFLMADLFREDKQEGKSWAEALDSNFSGTHTRYPVSDEEKILHLYTVMQRAAHKNPGKKITLDFYDDREAILQGLYVFFSSNAHMIPKTVQLNLFHRGVAWHEEDQPFHETPSVIGSVFGQNGGQHYKKLRQWMQKHVKPFNAPEFEGKNPDSLEAHIHALKNQARSLWKRRESAQDVCVLVHLIVSLESRLETLGLKPSEARTPAALGACAAACRNDIKQAEPYLRRHRDIGGTLNKLLLIFTAGVGYLLLCGIKGVLTGKFNGQVFETTSGKLAAQTAEALTATSIQTMLADQTKKSNVQSAAPSAAQ